MRLRFNQRLQKAAARVLVGIASAALITGCGGGGSPNPSLPLVAATPIVASPISGGSGGGTSTTPTTATFILSESASAQDAVSREQAYRATNNGGRRPMFVSPGTQGVTITATPNGGSPTIYVYNVSSGSSLCSTSGSTRTCTMPVAIDPGTYSFTMTLYDQAPTGAPLTIPSTANALGVSNLGSVVIAPHTTNNVAFSVEGIVSGVALSGGASFISLPANGIAHTAGLALVVTDASGATISGAYASPIAVSLSESGGSGHSQLELNGSPVGANATLTKSSDSLAIAYDGGGSPGYTTTTSFGGVSGAVRMSPLYVSGSLAFTDQAQAKSVSISEADSPFTSAPSVSWSCSGFTPSISGTNASATYSVTSPALTVGSPAPSYSCPATVTITDALGTSISTTEGGGPTFTTACASVAANIYVGAASGTYILSNGSPCPLVVSGANEVVVYDPADASHPASASLSVSEQRDTKAASINASACSPYSITASSSVSPGSNVSSAMTGTVNVGVGTSALTFYGCNVIVSDGNGQSVSKLVIIDPSTYATSYSGAYSFAYGDSCNFTVFLCTGDTSATGGLASGVFGLLWSQSVVVGMLSTSVAPTSPSSELTAHVSWSVTPGSISYSCAGATPGAGFPGNNVTAYVEVETLNGASGWLAPGAITNGQTITWYNPSATPGTYDIALNFTGCQSGNYASTSPPYFESTWTDIAGTASGSISQM